MAKQATPKSVKDAKIAKAKEEKAFLAKHVKLETIKVGTKDKSVWVIETDGTKKYAFAKNPNPAMMPSKLEKYLTIKELLAPAKEIVITDPKMLNAVNVLKEFKRDQISLIVERVKQLKKVTATGLTMAQRTAIKNLMEYTGCTEEEARSKVLKD